MRRFENGSGRVWFTAPYRLLPPPTASYPPYRLVFRRQRPIPLQQLRLPAPQRDLSPTDIHVLNACREIEGVASPDDDVRDFPGLERSVPVSHPENLGRRERHRPERLIPRH